MVNIALGNVSVTTCEAGDANHDNEITIDEILTAVNNALNGCSVPWPISALPAGCTSPRSRITAAGHFRCCASKLFWLYFAAQAA
jgi:hypothetical protein